MSKEKQSKLDGHAERLDHWFGVEKKTLDEVREQLLLDGVSVSCSRLSDWWSARQTVRLQERLLVQITTGARQVQEVEAAFTANPAPGMETIANLHRLIAFQLATKGASDPELLELSTKCTAMVLDFAKLQEKKAERELAEQKYRDLVAQRKEAIAREMSQARAGGGISAETVERIERELKLL